MESNFEKTDNRARRVKQVCLISMLAIIIAIVPVAMSGKWVGLGLLIITALVLVIALWQVKRGRVDLSASIIVVAVSTFMLLYAWLNEGIRDEVLLIFPTMVTYSVLVGSTRIANFLIIIVLLNVGLIGVLVDLGYASFVSSDDGLERAIPIMVIFAATGLSIKMLGIDLSRANKALEQSKAELEDRVEERTRELSESLMQLKRMQSQLVESEKMASMGRLVAGVAHEINTPVGVAITANTYLKDINHNFSQQIESGKVKRSELQKLLEETKQSTKLINSSLQRAAALIGDFKNVSVMKSDKCKAYLKPDEQLEHVISSLKPGLESANVSITIKAQDVGKMAFDPVAFMQILTSLIDNSLIHGFSRKQSGEISITLYKKEQQIYLDYADDGVGIPGEIQHQIFEPFVTTNRGTGGSGLGMHIVYNLITHSFGGTIELDKAAEKGAHFILSWPVQEG